MAALTRAFAIPTHPILAVLLAGMAPLFLGGLLSDLAYSSSYEIQWSNFAAWLIAGAMVFAGFALLWALIDMLRARRFGGRPLFLFLLLAAVFVLGLINSFIHARDAWAVMPAGPILSAIVTVLALLTTAVGFARFGGGDVR